jgi:hypothetical protein
MGMTLAFSAADANRPKGIEGEKGQSPDVSGRAVEEYLAVLDNAAVGAATEVTPKFVSPADPAVRWTGAHGGQAFCAYSANYLIDVEHAVMKLERLRLRGPDSETRSILTVYELTRP